MGQEQIKGLITSLMLSTPVPVRSQLSEALTIIGRHDFPAKWMTLLPELLERLKTGDIVTVGGVLETANSIFKRYRCPIASHCYSSPACPAAVQNVFYSLRSAFAKIRICC